MPLFTSRRANANMKPLPMQWKQEPGRGLATSGSDSCWHSRLIASLHAHSYH